MTIKKLTLGVVVLVVASLAIAGCTSPTTTSPSPSQATTQHNATLEQYLSIYQNTTSRNYTVKAWEVTWKNNTAAHVENTIQNKTNNITTNYQEDFIIFSSTDAATQYVNSLNKTGFVLASTVYPSGGAYQVLTGHPPAVYKEYKNTTGESILNFSVERIVQLDNIVDTFTARNIA